MAKILLGWELGAGLGHVRPMRMIAEALAQHGHEPVLAVKHLVEPWPLLQDSPFPIIQAPVWTERAWISERPFLAHSFADILALRGFTDSQDLSPMVQGWQALIDLIAPELVICDHAPTLCLAAFGSLPTVLYGTGFNLPPGSTDQFPALVPHQAPLVTCEQLLNVIIQVQNRRCRPVPASLPALFEGSARFINVLPELDPYRRLRKEHYSGPIQELPSYSPLPSSTAYFAYLAAENSSTEFILRGLARSGFDGVSYIRGSTSEQRAEYESIGLRISATPLDLRRLMPQVSLVIHHGSMGLAEQALAAGRPQLLVPGHLEQYLTGQLLESLGTGIIANPQADEAAWFEALYKLANQSDYSFQAAKHAALIQQRGPSQALSEIVNRCLTLLHSV